MKLKKLVAAFFAAGFMGLTGTANAYILVDDWNVDLGALGDRSGAGEDDFTGFGVLGAVGVPGGSNGINSMTFSALYRASGTFTGPLGSPSPGDKFTTDLAGVATGFIGDAGLIPLTSTNKFANFDFEITFVATTTQQIGNFTLPEVSNFHLGAGAGPDGFVQNGLLAIYADVINGAGDLAGVKANTAVVGGGAGMNDGTLIALFRVLAEGDANNPTGSFNLAALDGQDDASFEMISNPFGIIRDSAGNALIAGSTVAFTNSNTDSDDDNNGVRDTNPGAGLFAGSCTSQDNANNCGIEDGSLNLATAVPEPGSLALVGLALAGIGVSMRRRQPRVK